jgi:hypothetical protein
MANFCEHGNEPSVSIKKAGYSLTGEELSTFQRISCIIEFVKCRQLCKGRGGAEETNYLKLINAVGTRKLVICEGQQTQS